MQPSPTTTRNKCGPIRGLGRDDDGQQEDGEWNSVGISTLQHRQTHMLPPAPFLLSYAHPPPKYSVSRNWESGTRLL